MNETIILKHCTKCGHDKPLSEFCKQSTTKDGLRYHCKTCVKTQNQARYQKKSPDIIKQVREWQAKNKEKVKAYQKAFKEKKKV